jgi:hypothetical protein
MATNKPPFRGHHSYASSAEDSPVDTGSAPRVQRYQSGQNAHGMRQRATRGPEPGESSGIGRLDGPERFKGK